MQKFEIKKLIEYKRCNMINLKKYILLLYYTFALGSRYSFLM